MYPHGGIVGLSLASGPLRKSSLIGLALAAVALAAPASASAQATLVVDEVAPCYREQSTVNLVGGGFTQNGEVVFTRDGSPDEEGVKTVLEMMAEEGQVSSPPPPVSKYYDPQYVRAANSR